MGVPANVLQTPSRQGRARILHRYLLRLWLRYALAVTTVLTLVVAVLYFAEVMSRIAGGDLPLSLLWWQTVLRLPEAVQTVMPIGAPLGLMFAMGRLWSEQELTQIAAAGLSPRDLLRPWGVCGLGVALLAFALSGWIVPFSGKVEQDLLDRAARSAEFWGLQEGRFVNFDGGGVIYVHRLARDGAAREVFVNWRHAPRNQVLTASTGRFWLVPGQQARYVRLEHGRRVARLDSGRVEVLDFEAAEVRLPPPGDAQRQSRPQRWRWAKLLASEGHPAVAEIHWRLAQPVATAGLLLTAFVLSFPRPQRGFAGRWLILLVTFVVYLNLLNLGRIWLAAGTLPAQAGLWWLHLVFWLPPGLAAARMRRRL